LSASERTAQGQASRYRPLAWLHIVREFFQSLLLVHRKLQPRAVQHFNLFQHVPYPMCAVHACDRVQAGLTIIDFAVDWGFVIERFREEGTGSSSRIPLVPALSAVFLVVPIATNVVLTLSFMRHEFKNEAVRKLPTCSK